MYKYNTYSIYVYIYIFVCIYSKFQHGIMYGRFSFLDPNMYTNQKLKATK